MHTLSMEGREQKAGTGTEERYELLATLGRGGMGCVYKARDRATGEIVALKVLLDCHANNPVLAARFEREAQFASRIRHANVAIVHGVVEHGNRRCLKMEHVEGTTVECILAARKKLSPDVALRMFGQICAGVQAAHDVGLVHRDIKPANVLIAARDGRAVILDFGIAKSVEEASVTKAGVLLGSLDYMSPEQLSGIDVTARTDVYSLGVLLYEMVTGVCPLRVPDVPLLTRMQMRMQMDDPRRHEPTLPPFLVDAIGKCLQPEPADRHGTPMELWESLNPSVERRAREERSHVVLVAGSPVFVNGAPLAVVVAPPGDLRVNVVDRLKRLGCRVAEFNDGRDALIYSLQHHCHVLVMSASADGIDPWEACGVMKRYARFDATRMLVLVDDTEEAAPQARSAGVSELVALPLDGDDFAQRIRRLLD